MQQVGVEMEEELVKGWGQQDKIVKQPLPRCVLITVSVVVIQGVQKFLLPEDSTLVSI